MYNSNQKSICKLAISMVLDGIKLEDDIVKKMIEKESKVSVI